MRLGVAHKLVMVITSGERRTRFPESWWLRAPSRCTWKYCPGTLLRMPPLRRPVGRRWPLLQTHTPQRSLLHSAAARAVPSVACRGPTKVSRLWLKPLAPQTTRILRHSRPAAYPHDHLPFARPGASQHGPAQTMDDDIDRIATQLEGARGSWLRDLHMIGFALSRPLSPVLTALLGSLGCCQVRCRTT
jgi:hypothetical protein